MMFILAYLLIGILAGFFSGLLGIGGGIFVVPALLYVFDLQNITSPYIMQIVIGTSLAVMCSSTLFAFLIHQHSNKNIFPIYKRLFLGVVVGAIIGAILASLMSSKVLRVLFGILLICVAIFMVVLIRQSTKKQLPNYINTTAVGAIIGVLSGIFGIGGGIIAVPYLTFYNVNIRTTIGVSAAVAFTVALVGSLAYILLGLNKPDLPTYTLGFIYWPAFLIVGVLTPLFAYFGAKLAQRMPTTVLRYIFAVLLCVIGLDMISSSR